MVMKTTTKMFLGAAAVMLVSSTVAGVTTYSIMNKNQAPESFTEMFSPNPYVKLASMSVTEAQPIDLTQAAEMSVHAVVHIKSTQNGREQIVQTPGDIFDFFFGNGYGPQRRVRTQPRVGIGSGVIISKDGYIVTNNHVIDEADEIEVTLNDNREFKGRLIGTDPDTDLALIKIEGDDLPTIPVGDSDALKVGEWVLAIGNPFNLTSTVTAGIVSAKARTLGVYNGGIESFIQTDAAINEGNSGGALLNMNGELIGINEAKTASSSTGTAVDNIGFAIPIDKAETSLKQLMNLTTREKVDESQASYLGIEGQDVSEEATELYGIPSGVVVAEVVENGPADEAGVKKGDILTELDGRSISNMEQLHEVLEYYAAGEKVDLVVQRADNGAYQEQTLSITLGSAADAQNE